MSHVVCSLELDPRTSDMQLKNPMPCLLPDIQTIARSLGSCQNDQEVKVVEIIMLIKIE